MQRYSGKILLLWLTLTLFLLGASKNSIHAQTNCVIPPSGPWTSCATGGGSTDTQISTTPVVISTVNGMQANVNLKKQDQC